MDLGDSRTFNQIDYILTNKIQIVKNVEALNRFNTGSDHRIVRASICINWKLERNNKIGQTTPKRIDREKLQQEPTKFNTRLESRLKEHRGKNTDINQINKIITDTLKTAVEPYILRKPIKTNKLKPITFAMLEQRRKLITQNKRATVEYAETNRSVRRMVKRDIREYKTKIARKYYTSTGAPRYSGKKQET